MAIKQKNQSSIYAELPFGSYSFFKLLFISAGFLAILSCLDLLLLSQKRQMSSLETSPNAKQFLYAG